MQMSRNELKKDESSTKELNVYRETIFQTLR